MVSNSSHDLLQLQHSDVDVDMKDEVSPVLPNAPTLTATATTAAAVIPADSSTHTVSAASSPVIVPAAADNLEEISLDTAAVTMDTSINTTTTATTAANIINNHGDPFLAGYSMSNEPSTSSTSLTENKNIQFSNFRASSLLNPL